MHSYLHCNLAFTHCLLVFIWIRVYAWRHGTVTVLCGQSVGKAATLVMHGQACGWGHGCGCQQWQLGSSARALKGQEGRKGGVVE